jgi:hypothetical protein
VRERDDMDSCSAVGRNSCSDGSGLEEVEEVGSASRSTDGDESGEMSTSFQTSFLLYRSNTMYPFPYSTCAHCRT